MPFHKGYAACLRVTEGDRRVTGGDRRVTEGDFGLNFLENWSKTHGLWSKSHGLFIARQHLSIFLSRSHYITVTLLSPSVTLKQVANALHIAVCHPVTLIFFFYGVMKDDMGSPSKNNPETNKGFSASSQKKGVLYSRLPHRVCKAASVSINLC